MAFPPAFKILRASVEAVRAETISLSDVPPDPGIAAVYRAEGQEAALALGALLAQRRAYVLEHRVPRDWPAELRAWLVGKTAADLVELVGGDAGAFAVRHGVGPAVCPLRDLIADAYLIKAAGPGGGVD